MSLYYRRATIWPLSVAAFLLLMPLESKSVNSALRRLGLALPGILFLYNGSPPDTLSSLGEGFSIDDAQGLLKREWQVHNRQQLIERLTSLGNDGASRSFRYLRQIVADYGAVIDNEQMPLADLYRAGSRQTQQLGQRLMELYPSIDPFELRRLYLLVHMRASWQIFPAHLRGWDLARLVALARWGYDLGYLSEDEAWQYIEFAATEVKARFDSWPEFVENYIYGRLFEYSSQPQAVLLLRDSVLLWWQLRERGGAWHNLALNLYEPGYQSPLLKLFEPLHVFHQAIRDADLEGVRTLIARQEELALPRLSPADSALYLPLDQPDAHRRSVLSLAIANYGLLNLLLSSGFRYDSGDADGGGTLQRAIQTGQLDSVQALLPRYRQQLDRAGRGPLHWAAGGQDSSLIALLIQAGFSTQATDALGNTPLHLAAQYSRVSVNQILWDNSDTALLARANQNGQTPLHLAILNQQAANLAALMLRRYGEQLALNGADQHGATPLMLAAQQGSVAASLMLLELGADASAVDRAGWTALHYAAARGKPDLVRLLLQYSRTALNQQTHDGVSALMLAAQHEDAQVLTLLLNNGADPLLADAQGRLALHYAVGAAAAGLLLEAGTPIDAPDRQGWPPLWYAVQAKQTELLVYLLDSGAEVSAARQAFLLAIEAQDYPMVELLIARGFPLQGEAEGEENLLAAAAKGKSYQILWALGEAGADWGRGDRDGNLPLHWASRSGSAEMVGYLLARGAEPMKTNLAGQTALHLAAQDLEDGAAKVRLLAAKSDLDALSGEGWTALAYAAAAGNFAAVRELLNAGAQVQQRQAMMPALVAAARAGSDAIMRLLLERGADADAESTPVGPSALHYTVASRMNIFWTVAQRLQMSEILLARGARVDATDQQGNTPLFWAALRGAPQLVALLLAQAADPAQTNDQGLTALQYALESSWENSYLLLEHGGSEQLSQSDGSGLLPLERTAQLGDKATLQLLLGLGADANQLGADGWRPLFFALHAPDPGNLMTLLRAGADPRLASGDGQALLGYALRTLAPGDNILALLAAVGADTVVDAEGNSALHLVVEQGRPQLIAPLVAAGNPVNALNQDGETPLHLAVRAADEKGVRLLLAAGANPKIENASQVSPIQLAQQSGVEQLESLLTETGR